jgi:hypothetical protein
MPRSAGEIPFRPFRLFARCSAAAFALGAVLIFVPAAPGRAAVGEADKPDLAQARAALDRQFAERLAALAARCDQLGLAEQAAQTRRWGAPRDPRRQYLFVPRESDAAQPPADAPLVVAQWHARFREHRAAHAGGLFDLALQALAAGEAETAYRLVHEVVRENPDHAAARKVLGFRQLDGRWRRPVPEPSARTSTVAHPRYGWRPGQYWRVETEHYSIATNAGGEAGLELGRRLEELHAAWQQLFFRCWSTPESLELGFRSGTQPPAARRKFNVVFFRDREEYLARLRPLQPQIDITLGIYLDTQQTAFFYAGDARAEVTWLHEAAHQLFHETQRVTPRPGHDANFWVVEGAAMYMESLARHDDYLIVGGDDASRLQFARYRALVDGGDLPLSRLAALGRDPIQNDPQIRRIYSQSAGWAHFLMDYDDGRYRRALVDYLRRVYAGRDRADTLFELCGAAADELERQYQEFLVVGDDDVALWPAAGKGPSPPLRDLCLARTRVSDKSLALLAGQKELAWLDLSFTAAGDAGLRAFGDSRGLKQLNLERTAISDQTLAMIASFAELEELDLSQTAVTDAGLAHLAALSKLKSLWLTGTPIGDAGLARLAGLKQLETLDVNGTKATAEGYDRLKAALPRLNER